MKSKWVSLVLCLFLGWLGAHRFYENKIATGVLYLCTLGIFGIGWVFDLWLLLIKPNTPITETHEYGIYLRVVEALEKGGYSVEERRRDWCIIEAGVNGGSCGYIFVVADPRPGILSSIIGTFSSGYKKARFEHTEYGRMQSRFDIIRSRFKRQGYDFGSYYYWPEESLVAGVAAIGDMPADDNEWLSILEPVIG